MSKKLNPNRGFLEKFRPGEVIETSPDHLRMFADERLNTEGMLEMVKQYHTANEEEVAVTREFRGYFFQDTLVQIHRTLQEMAPAFGASLQTFFGNVPPQTVTVDVGPGESVQVPVGEMTIPLLENARMHIRILGSTSCNLHFLVKGKYKERVQEIVEEVERKLREESIFFGSVIEMDGEHISFLDPKDGAKDLDVLTLSPSQKLLFEVGILGRIQRWQEYQERGAKPRFGVLLYGAPGTGKTMIQRIALSVNALQGGVSVMLRNAEDAVRVLNDLAPVWARSGKLVVVAFEDIDRIAAERDDLAQALTLALDGVSTKGLSILTVVTTNHLERVADVVKRRGRFDMHLHTERPGQEEVREILEKLAGDNLTEQARKDLPAFAARLTESGVVQADVRSLLDDATASMVVAGREMIDSPDLEYATANWEHMMAGQVAHQPPKEADVVKAARVVVTGLQEAIRAAHR